MEILKADLVVIGSGPAGQKAAIQAAKSGKSVIVIEKGPFPGGGSLNSGTIPSKSLREAILDLTRFNEKSFYGKERLVRDVSINDLNHRLQCVLEEERALIKRQFEKNEILLIQGSARIENKSCVLVVDSDKQMTHRLNVQVIMIATGSKPRNPINVPFDDKVILDSTRLLSIDKLPNTMIVLGGGIIGSEYASFFAALGVRVTVVDKKGSMLHLLDKEIGTHLQKALAGIGLEFAGNKVAKEIVRSGDKAVVCFEDGTSREADVLLYAMGRTASVDDLGLENINITLDAGGYILVNPFFQTVVPNIYAVGDVIGGPSLASTSMEQGRLAARHAFGYLSHTFPTSYPTGIYTIPEISSIGYTEAELTDLGFRYEVGRAYYYELARSHITGSDVGLFKILFHSETLQILGIHIIGRSATELIHIGQVAMSFKASIDYFIDQVFNYPTFAEGYRVAALNGYNKIKYLK